MKSRRTGAAWVGMLLLIVANSARAQSLLIDKIYRQDDGLAERLTNTVPGQLYGILRGPGLVNPDFFNQPRELLAVSQAESDTMLLTLPMTNALAFDQAISLDDYWGPDPKISGIAENQVVTGWTAVTLSDLGDVFPYTSRVLTYDANGNLCDYGTLSSTPARKWINPARLARGPAILYVESRATQGVDVGSEDGDYFCWNWRTVIFTNDPSITVEDYCQYADAGTAPQFTFSAAGSLGNAPYTLTVSDEQSNLLYSASGNFVDGYAYAGWDGASNGMAYESLGHTLTFTMSAEPAGLRKLPGGLKASSASTHSAIFPVSFGGSVSVKQRMYWMQETTPAVDDLAASAIGGLKYCNWLGVLIGNLQEYRLPYDLYNPGDDQPCRFRVATQAGDFGWFTNQLGDVANASGLLVNCHGGPLGLFGNILSGYTHPVSEALIRQIRHNQILTSFSIGPDGNFSVEETEDLGNPLFDTQLYACHSAYLHKAFGCPDIQYANNPYLAPRVFLGFDSHLNVTNNLYEFMQKLDMDFQTGQLFFDALRDARRDYPKIDPCGPHFYGNPRTSFVTGGAN